MIHLVRIQVSCNSIIEEMKQNGLLREGEQAVIVGGKIVPIDGYVEYTVAFEGDPSDKLAEHQQCYGPRPPIMK